MQRDSTARILPAQSVWKRPWENPDGGRASACWWWAVEFDAALGGGLPWAEPICNWVQESPKYLPKYWAEVENGKVPAFHCLLKRA